MKINNIKMNLNLHSPNKLTEFARDFDSEPETFMSKMLNRITNVYNNSYNTVNVIPSSDTTTESQQDRLTASTLSSSHQNDHSNSATVAVASESSSSTSYNSSEKSVELSPNPEDERSVIQRILLTIKNDKLTSYKDTELQRFWMPDSKSKECYECSQKFTTFRRKHHCRLCGQIFCAKCCNQVVPGKIIKCSGDLKVCTYCSKIVLSYLNSSDITSDLKSDLQSLQDDLSLKLSIYNNTNQMDNQFQCDQLMSQKLSVGYQEERLVSGTTSTLSNAERKNILQQSNSLKTLYDEMVKNLPYQNRGHDLLSYLISYQKASNKVQAIVILNEMIYAEFLIPLNEIVLSNNDNNNSKDVFNENCLYKLVRMDEYMSHSGSSFKLDLDLEASSVHLSRPSQDISFSDDCILQTSSQDSSFGFSTSKDWELQNSLISTVGSKPLMESFCDHEELLLNQLLRNENLAESWSKILLPLCARIANSIRPEQCGIMDLMDPRNQMDIRNFVNFKKVPGGLRNESKIVGGVVFTKNVVHKEMQTRIEHPKVLLLQCAIVFQRVEGKFVSIESLLMQEKQYLENVTTRILNLKPDVILVHKNVAGIAQDMLRRYGITLVLDVKLSVLNRLARCLNCDIISSINSNIGQPKLGTCDRFYIQNFDGEAGGINKTLMFFEIPSSLRGCCVLLRGGQNTELIKVKKVALLLLFARYNWRLELSFLLDEFARPPSPKPSIFDSKEQSPAKITENEFIESIECQPTTTMQGTNPVIQNQLSLEDEVFGKDNSSGQSQKEPIVKMENRSMKNEKKSEDKVVNKENVQDFSDPLRATHLSPSVFESTVGFAVETPYDNRFRTALSSTVLSVSPFVAFPLPFLETEQGRKCVLRSYYPNELYYSKQWSTDTFDVNSNIAEKTPAPYNDAHPKLNPPHPFLSYKITSNAESKDYQSLLASYRASGGRLPKTLSMKPLSKKECSVPQQELSKNDNDSKKDALDLSYHQRLPVLFCSYYYNPKTSSLFCAQPSLLIMQFYGTNDIMLGKFLEYYCFRRSYMCRSCKLPMLHHVRRYVHSMGCIQVKLTEDLTTQNAEQILMTSWCSICQEMTPSVPMSKDTWCLSFAKFLELRFHGHSYKRRCVDMIQNKENTSDMHAKESEKSQMQCSHSLHRDHILYFSYNGIVASFSYTPIEAWEIGLPSFALQLNTQKHIDPQQLLEDIKYFAVKGYEVYAKIHEKLADFAGDGDFPMLAALKQMLTRDQSAFREKVGIVQMLLTETELRPYEIYDAMVVVRKTLADNIDVWHPKLQEASMQSRLSSKNEVAPTHTPVPIDSTIDSGTICTEDLKHDISTLPIEDDFNDIPVAQQDSVIVAKLYTEFVSNNDSSDNSPNKLCVDTKDGGSTSLTPTSMGSSDKKSVKTLLRELLPSEKNVITLQSPISNHEHYGFPICDFPMMVHDQDLSSVIAYSLISNEYKKALENLKAENNEQMMTMDSGGSTSASPNIKRKSQDMFSGENVGGSDEKDSKEEVVKKSKSALHIEVNFQDTSTQFICKTYFARDFHTLRMNFLNLDGNNSKEEQQKQHAIHIGFVRSLSQSMKWEARGGKSGSKFCKTLDDRFVIKEMSKNDIQVFENFAPNYFVYINQCLQTNQPTLLAKIFGVFKVNIKKKDSMQEKSLLIMENLFYNSEITNKFDLKGSDRNRLVDPSNQNGEIVLLDENLIQMSWSNPLYILSHSKAVLRHAINRDAQFLEKNDVMDYSLLVGLNSNDKLLVLGIIDYIRTFTLDKRIESMVKQTGILGGQGKLPTVISPKQYRQRFTDAMERYFLAVPDRWEKLTKH